jgi:hypothetical protein
MTADPAPPDVDALLRRAYAAFNAKDVEAVLATLHEDVDWPNVLDGGRVHGHDEVRAYWLRQFASIDPRVEALDLTVDEQGRVAVRVHQTVRDLDGTVVDERTLRHVYTLDGGLVVRMDIHPASPAVPFG